MSDGGERTFWRMQCHCDDEGRILASPRFIASKVYPFGPHGPDAVAAFIKEWVKLGYVIAYSADGKHYLQVADWHRFQRPQRAQESLIPPPEGVRDKYATSTRQVRAGEKGREEGEGVSKLFERFYESYPLHKERAAAEKAFVKAIELADVEEIITAAKRYADDPTRDPKFTKNPATWLNKGCWDDEPAPTDGRTTAAFTVNGQ